MVAFGNVKLFYENIPSTNLKVSQLLASGNIENGMAVHAAFQSNGKGQQAKFWHSEEGQNLLVSYGVKHDALPVDKLFYLNAFVSLALVEVLQDYIDETFAIKWPNDIYVSHSKIAGILIENVLAGHNIKTSVIGIGLNVNQRNFPVQIPNPASMVHYTGKTLELLPLLDQISGRLSTYYRLVINGEEQQLWQQYNKKLYGKNQLKTFTDARDLNFEATILEVLPNGRILLDVGHEQKSFNFGEIRMLIYP
jgi:BirA family biotin operon repressor/biotin-[acetyl-CoA-carboxylase] ligase